MCAHTNSERTAPTAAELPPGVVCDVYGGHFSVERFRFLPLEAAGRWQPTAQGPQLPKLEGCRLPPEAPTHSHRGVTLSLSE